MNPGPGEFLPTSFLNIYVTLERSDIMKPVQYDLYLAIVFYFGLDRPPEISVCLRRIPF